jgi:hypothetical protein
MNLIVSCNKTNKHISRQIVDIVGDTSNSWNQYIQNLKLNISSRSVWQGLQPQRDKANLMFPLLLLSLMARTSLLVATVRKFSF